MAIQKLTLQDDTRLVYTKDYVLALRYIQTTVNQLVDAVNELQGHIKFLDERIKTKNFMVDILEEHAHPTATTEPAENTIMAKNANVAENSQSAKIAQGFKNLQKPYDEQRWVGCLCKLWTGDGLVRYGILRGVALNRKKTNYPYQALSTSFEHCEPVKPDDDIIYRGE